jgi:hypothetical protein
MIQRRDWAYILGVAALALTTIGQVTAAPPSPWLEANIGAPDQDGSSTVEGDKWTISGSGNDFNGKTEDQLYYVYQPLTGDGSLQANLLAEATEGSQLVGAMVRASLEPGSPMAGTLMSTSALNWLYRTQPNAAAVRVSSVSPEEYPKLMRVQRVGNSLAGYTSTDGTVWQQVTPPLEIPLGASPLIGLAVSSRSSDLTTVEFDQVRLQTASLLPHGIKACGGNAAVVLEWKPLAGAEEYRLYRAAAGEEDLTKFTRVTDTPIAGTTYTDAGGTLVNDQPVDYLLAGVFKAADGTLVEGEKVRFQGTPGGVTITGPPQGFTSTSINETVACGTGVIHDAATGVTTIRGSGGDIWGRSDQFNFMSQEAEGNFQVTVKALGTPTETDVWAKAGLMVRESLEAGGRHAMLVLTPQNGLVLQHRPEANADSLSSTVLGTDELQPPILIRLTREGDIIRAAYSTDDGATFEEGGEVELTGLAAKVQVGLAITAHNATRISEAKFQNLEIKK